VFDFKFQTARISKTLQVPEDFTLPYMQETGGVFDKTELLNRWLNNLRCLYAPCELIKIYQYTQKKHLIRTLTWSEKYNRSGEVPIFAYSLRSFIECTANYHSGINQIEAAFEAQDSKEKHDESWAQYLKTGLYDLILALISPTTIEIPNSEIPANSFDPKNIESNMEEAIEVMAQYKKPELNNNETLANTKSAPLRPVNVLTNLKKLERDVDGIHPAYDLLSEVLHPNSFPIMSQINVLNDFKDLSKPTVTWRFKNQVTITPEFYNLENIPNVINACVDTVLRKDKVLPTLNKKLKSEIKVHVRPVVDELLSIGIPEHDTRYCFCGSGKLLKKCCARVR
jgi:hypothetical protein